MKRKWLAVGIILLFVGVTIAPTINAQDTEKSQSTSRDNWLYVGGSGPGNYTRIQDAIDNASDGDRIFVYNGTYHEALHVDKFLNIIGENRNTTCIDANFSYSAVTISHEFVYLYGFTIIGKNTSIQIDKDSDFIAIVNNNLSFNNGILCMYHSTAHLGNILWDNIFYSNTLGCFFAGNNNFIEDNVFIDNDVGGFFTGSNNCIRNNTFLHCRNAGLQLLNSSSWVEDNIFIGNDFGLQVGGSEHQIIGNLFWDNSIGVQLVNTTDTIVQYNNFVHNKKHASFYLKRPIQGNNWDSNYWSGFFDFFKYKCIFGRIQICIPWISKSHLHYYPRWIAFDKHPAQEPYDIPGMK
jgi:nitrous oxidase accessory protein NosD